MSICTHINAHCDEETAKRIGCTFYSNKDGCVSPYLIKKIVYNAKSGAVRACSSYIEDEKSGGREGEMKGVNHAR